MLSEEQLVLRLQDARVMVVGDLMLDRAVFGKVARISPEAPIPVLESTREQVSIGGAGNVVANLAALGTAVAAAGIVGTDADGDAVAERLAAMATGGTLVVRDPARPTSVKTRYWGGGQQLLRVDREDRAPIGADQVDQLLAWIAHGLGKCGALVLSDYAKGALPPPLLERAIELARQAGRPVLVDPKGRDYRRYHGASLLTPNRGELADATGLPVQDDAAVITACRELKGRAGVEAVLATLGADGMLLLDHDDRTARIAGIRREVFDVVGAGDTVIATLAATIASGAELRDAARLANLAGSIAVTRIGTAPVGRTDLLRELAPTIGKITSLDQAVPLVAAVRAEGRRVGFTNGVFDLLHEGHVRYLHAARARCDFLVVGLNSDASVRRLKGPTRPVNGLDARARVLAALADVDLVVPFEEDTPLSTILALRPDLLVKGADYREDQVVGAAEVRGWGGEVHLAELTEGVSTTELLRRGALSPAGRRD